MLARARARRPPLRSPQYFFGSYVYDPRRQVVTSGLHHRRIVKFKFEFDFCGAAPLSWGRSYPRQARQERMMTKARWILLAVVLVAAAAGWWWLADGQKSPDAIVLYGNVDLRQADLPFNASERVTEVLVQEGDHVKSGQVMARLDTTRIEPQVAKAEADAAAAQQVVNRMHAGSRPEEIAQARANVLSAQADTDNAQPAIRQARRARAQLLRPGPQPAGSR